MLHFDIDPRRGVPVYRQLMDQVKYYVASGALKPGDQLPSIRELAKSLHVNPATIVKAYGELAHEGAIEMQHGKGVFVTEGGTRMTPAEKEGAVRELARHLSVEASQMGIDGEEVLRIVREELRRIAAGIEAMES